MQVLACAGNAPGLVFLSMFGSSNEEDSLSIGRMQGHACLE